MSTVRLWPQCAECSDRNRGWWPVEGYELQKERAKSHVDEYEAVVVASCHGQKQSARFGKPHWWGEAHLLDAIKSLVFFAPGSGAPMHGLVDRI